MSDWNAAAADYLIELGRRQPARAPATLAEIWDAEWKRSGLDTISGIGRPFNESYDELAGAIEKHAGTDLGTLAFQHGVNMGAAVTPDLRIAALNALADALPEEARKEIEPLRDVRRRAADKAQAIEREAADVAGATYGLTGHATAVLAGIARQTVDPVNLLANVVTAPLGGPFKGPVLRMVARQGAAGAAAQILVEPYVQADRAELGLDAGFARGAIDVGQAALGAAGLAGLLRAGGAAFRLMRPETRAAAPVPLGDVAPTFEPTFVGYLDHEQYAAFERGEPLKPTVPIGEGVPDTIPGFSRPFDIAAGAEARPTRTRLPDEPPRPPGDEHVPSFSADDAAAFERGEPLKSVVPIGEGMPDTLPGFSRSFDIAAGAEARPTRTRLPDEPPRPPGDEHVPDFSADDAAAFERGGRLADVHPLGAGETPWRGFAGLSSGDLEAAARLAERDQLIDGAAPPTWDRVTHHAMVDEAAAALEAGRPIDRAKAADAAAAAGVEKPAAAAIDDNPLSEAVRTIEVKRGKRFGVHDMKPESVSLFQFLASIGGLHPQDKVARDAAGALLGDAARGGGLTGELKHILDGNRFMPGMGMLLRETGLSLERARMAAAEAHYLPMDSTINDFLKLIREEDGGNRQYPQGHVAEPRRPDPARERELREEHRAGLAADFDARMAQVEITKVTKADKKRALQIIEKEGQPDPLLAYEQALAEKEARKEKLRARRNQEQDLRIPGWDVADDAGAAPQVGRDPESGAGSRSGEPGAGETARGAGEGAGTAGEQGQLGDPGQAADFDRLLEEHGGNLETTIRLPDGTLQRVSAAEHLKLLEEDARAASELFDCAGGRPEGEP